VIDKYVFFVKKWGSRLQYRKALRLHLPDSPVYGYLEGRIPHPSHTYLTIVEISEAEEKQFINKEIGERRTRLGAKVDQVTLEVRCEAFARFELELLYQNVIDWSNDDETRRIYEEKLLQRAYDTLLVLTTDKKFEKRQQVQKLAQEMVIIKHPFLLAWKIVIDWKDSENLSDWDVGVLHEHIEFFSEDGVSKVLKGFLDAETCPFARSQKPGSNTPNSESTDQLSPEDRLILMVEGLEESPSSLLSNRIMSDYYLFLEEYPSAVDTARKGQNLATQLIRDTGLKLQNTIDAINTTLANALISHQSPRHHPEAKSIFDEILARKPTSIPALLGVGLILAEDEDYPTAIGFLKKALQRDADNIKIRSELAWCEALNGEYEQGLRDLEAAHEVLQDADPRNRDMKAQLLYRIGYCKWHLDPSKAARKNRTGAYADFLAALQANVNLAPAYTMLGVFYADYAKDRKRARKCFQKAFEISSSEIEAAHRLAMNFADQGEWDLVEVVSQRVVDSGKARPAPGSKKKAFSWPFSALGVVQLNKQEFAKSIVSFQHALRLSPDDYHSWVGLGESYHNSGRYIAAARAFNQAQSLEGKQGLQVADTWFARYMLANVKRELGQFDEAAAGYTAVLQSRPTELGVHIALLQTKTDNAWRNVELGLFGEAVNSAISAIEIAMKTAQDRVDIFNLWKAVGDACSIFLLVKSRESDLPASDLQSLLTKDIVPGAYDILADVDNIGEYALMTLDGDMPASERPFSASILAQKRAILTSAHDVHGQAVSWYNLGWAEYRAQPDTTDPNNRRKSNKFLKAAVRCFKRAIELEAGNSEFWNALGVVTTLLNPQVAQHAFVRSLHLNERSAPVWVNFGVLCLLQNDHQLANDAFTRAQSADPDYAPAWLGQGLLALLFGDPKEGRLLFTHAFDISSSSSEPAKRQYVLSTFDFLLSNPTASNEIAQLIPPLYALYQLRSQTPKNILFQHLLALFEERIGSYQDAELAIDFVSEKVEAQYEESETQDSLSRYIQVQSDRARIQLSLGNHDSAIESAQAALDLSEEGKFNDESRRKWRLSAHLTAGLAYYYLKSVNEAIEMFRKALEESNDAPDIVCLLAQVLWTKGGEEERNVAREQLFECVEKHPDHVGAVILLGVIALLDSDEDAVEAVDADLQLMRMRDDVDMHDKYRVARVLAGITAFNISKEDPASKEAEMVHEADRSVMLAPAQPQGWSELAAVSSDAHAADMALKTTLRAVPPNGSLGAEGLSKAYRQSGTAGDIQRAIMLAPWKKEGWIEFSELCREVVSASRETA
jgi:superkiller protein 3